MKPSHLKEKITLIGFITLLLLMIALITEILFHFQLMNHQVKELVEKTHSKLAYAFAMRDAIQLRANGLKTILLQPDPFLRDEEYLRFQTYAAQYRQAREGILNLGLSSQELKLHKKLSEHVSAAQPLNEYVNDLLRVEEEGSEQLSIAVTQAIQAQNALLSLLDSFIALEKIEVSQSVAETDAAYQQNLQYIILFSALILMLGVAIATWVVRQGNYQHRQLSYQASHDVLTGLLNRAAFEQQLSMALNDYQLKGQSYGLLYMDLDFFKQVNDSCGHPAGDKLLQDLTQEIQQCLRKSDHFGRMGGDEFTVLLTHCQHPVVLKVANRILQCVADFKFIWEGKTFQIGISIGIACIDQHTDSISTLLNLADEACYAAKAKGRNCIHIALSQSQSTAHNR